MPERGSNTGELTDRIILPKDKVDGIIYKCESQIAFSGVIKRLALAIKSSEVTLEKRAHYDDEPGPNISFDFMGCINGKLEILFNCWSEGRLATVLAEFFDQETTLGIINVVSQRGEPVEITTKPVSPVKP